MNEMASALAYLRSPLAVRARCEQIFEAGTAGSLAHFSVDLGALPAVTAKVVEVTRAAHPTLDIPAYGRIGHLRAGGVDRVTALEAALADVSEEERARAWVDLVIVSVLLDAGAGDAWRFREPGTDLVIGRSEGLAIASLHAFRAGMFSSDPAQPLRVDAAALRALDPAQLAAAFQATTANPLVGLEGRTQLVRDLGAAVSAAPRIFRHGRPGGLVDALRTAGPAITAPAILSALLDGLGPIWPGRITLGEHNLGDVWRHPAAGGAGPSEGLVPFHELSQWLAYSLFEPLERAGITVQQPGALTGLPEYRNGGLLVDLGVLVPKHAGVTANVHAVSDEVIVEWRALTVALLDRVAASVQDALGKTALELPLSRVLEGGTWAAGRAVAAQLREGGGPPIRIVSDGTVY